ncbi:MAG: ribulose-phosphate 3-epimerase [Candidatus Omnitrophica bacterium]|nr:ribulose-phosphate 3-epimerase [Candidatus Omnitrophota bacterium]
MKKNSPNAIQVSASILSADFSRLGEEIKRCEAAGADRFHVDVMDGHFVPVITMGPLIVAAIRSLTALPIDAHLMVEHPGMHLEQFIAAGADSIYLHAECYGVLRPACRGLGQFPKEVDRIDAAQILSDIAKIQKAGKKAFVTLNPGTPLCLEDILRAIDGVLIMSVNPGFAGQAFKPEAVEKIRQLRKIYSGDIAIDGGINAKTAPPVVAAGANILAAASYLFAPPDMRPVIDCLRQLKI